VLFVPPLEEQPDPRRGRRQPEHLGIEDWNERTIAGYWELPARKREAIRVCTGHFSFGVHEGLPRPSTYFTLLRDPIDQTLSEYHHRTLQGLDVSLRDYILSRSGASGNGQTQRLAGTALHRSGLSAQEMLDAAKQHLAEHFSVVGVTERWEETLLVLAEVFGWKRPYYHKRNVFPGRPRREDVDDAVLELIHQQNQLDVELHRFAREEFEMRLAREHPDIESRVDQLRRVNAKWQRVDVPVDWARRLRYFTRRSAALTLDRVREH
jgi:hypothetical protein